MNHVYRVVWNACTATFQVVSEIAKGDGRSQGGKTSQGGARYAAEPRLGAAALAVALVLLGLSQPTLAGPEGGSVARGDASISQSGTATTINQGSDRAVINWSRFSVGKDESVRFNQPSNTSATLNRVTGAERSEILGSMSANGHVFLINPNGVLVGAGAQVNVGGFIASTLDMNDDDFMSGKINLNGESTAAVTNEGEINAAEGGTVVLVAPEVNNAGTISAAQGSVVLAGTSSLKQGATTPAAPTAAAAPVPSPTPAVAVASPAPAASAPAQAPTPTASPAPVVASAPTSAPVAPTTTVATVAVAPAPAPAQIASGGGNTADAFTVRLQDGSNIAFTIDKGAVNAMVNNGGLIKAPGGQVILTAKGRDELSKATVNHSGVIEAQTTTTRNGVVELLADMKVGTVNLSGSINVAAVPTPAPAPTSASATPTARTLRGGFVETSAARINVSESAAVRAKGAPELGIAAGTWLIDPADITIAASGGNISPAQIEATLENGANVNIATIGSGMDAGDIHVLDSISATSPSVLIDPTYTICGSYYCWDGTVPNALTLMAHRNIVIGSAADDDAFLAPKIAFFGGRVVIEPNKFNTTDGKLYIRHRAGVDSYYGGSIEATDLVIDSARIGSGITRDGYNWSIAPMERLAGRSLPPSERINLYIDALDVSKVYDKVPWFGGSINVYGFAPGDDSNILTGNIKWLGSAQGAVDAGTYYMMPSGFSLSGAYAQKYSLIYKDGVLKIEPAKLFIVAQPETKTYDGTVASNLTPVVSGLIPGDGITGVNQFFSSKDVKGKDGSQINVRYGEIFDKFSLGSVVSNYQVVTVARDGTIQPARLFYVDGRIDTITYSGNSNAYVYGGRLSGVVGGDQVSVSSNGASYDSAYTGDRVVTAYWNLSGRDAGNYVIGPSRHAGRIITNNLTGQVLCSAVGAACGQSTWIGDNVSAPVIDFVSYSSDSFYSAFGGPEIVANFNEALASASFEGGVDTDVASALLWGAWAGQTVSSVTASLLELGVTLGKVGAHDAIRRVGEVKGWSSEEIRSKQEVATAVIDMANIVHGLTKAIKGAIAAQASVDDAISRYFDELTEMKSNPAPLNALLAKMDEISATGAATDVLAAMAESNAAGVEVVSSVLGGTQALLQKFFDHYSNGN